MRFIIAKARPLLEKPLNSAGLWLDDAMPILEAIDTKEELQEAIDDPEGFLDALQRRQHRRQYVLSSRRRVLCSRSTSNVRVELGGARFACSAGDRHQRGA